MKDNRITKLEKAANEIRQKSLQTVYRAKYGHIGGSMSEADILAALYFEVMNINPDHADEPDRDRFILSKGHSTPGYYSALALRGFFPVKVLDTFDQLDSILQGHPDMNKIPGVDMSSGSLGQGLSCGIGMAMGAAENGQDFTTFVLMGDGETQEGQIWEAALYAGAHHIRHIVGIVDYNTVQLSGLTCEVSDVGDLAAKWRAFGWTALTCNGHDMTELLTTLENAKAMAADGPVAVICHTAKGKGVSYMENQYRWHAKIPDDAEFAQGMAELCAAAEKIEEEER